MKWYLALVLLAVAAALIAAGSARTPATLGSGGVICNLIDPSDTDSLSPAQRSAVQRAIDSIRTPPPAEIDFRLPNGAHRTMSCAGIADDLQKQLNSGRIRVDTVNTDFTAAALSDGRTTTDGDQLNLRQGFLDSVVNGLIPAVHLEEILVHERKHKQQEEGDEWDLEIPALSAEKSYKDSCGVDTSDRWYKLCAEELKSAQWAHDGANTIRNIRPISAGGHEHFLICDTARGPAAMDWYTTFPFGDGNWVQFPLLPMRGSDHLLFSGLPMLPAGCVRSLICGGLPESGVARFFSLRVCSGQVTMIEAVRDFGPPLMPPMFFFAMDRDKESGRFLVLDTLNKQILNVADFDQDRIPDEITGTFASAFWPGFEGLLAGRGIDVRAHIYLGWGAMVNFFDAHLPHAFSPNDRVLFLPDVDGDHVADACLPKPLYEFTAYWPAVCVPPWAGDTEIAVLASWTHLIEVWTSDSLGETLGEPLAVVIMTEGGTQTVPLGRSLLAGEYVIARDVTWNRKLNRARQVIEPMPQALTISCAGDGMLRLHWSEVEGAQGYKLYASGDMIEFYDTGIVTEETALDLAVGPLDRQFYRVTAFR